MPNEKFIKYRFLTSTLIILLSLPTWAQEWQVVEENPGWYPRTLATVSTFGDSLYYMGGRNGNTSYNDIWISQDGLSWELLLESAPWNPGVGRYSIEYKGKLFIGGPASLNDALWYTSDGTSWNRVEDVPWQHSPRFYVFKDLLYGVGSGGVWSSVDGLNWNNLGEVSVRLPTHGVEVHNGFVYYFYASNVLPWYVDLLRTEDGSSFESVAFGDNHDDTNRVKLFALGATLTSYAGNLWLCGGSRYNGEGFAPSRWVHSSLNGAAWDGRARLPSSNSRTNHDAVVFDNKLFLLGGESFNGPPLHAIVYLEIESSEGEAPVEGELEGEGSSVEGEGGEPLSMPEQLLTDFALLSGNGDDVTFAAAQGYLPGLTQEMFDALDASEDGLLQVSELLEALGGAGPVHRADLNGNGIFELSELLRLIQAYNSQGYHCAANAGAAEDGFVLGSDATQQACLPHAADYDPQDWVINLSELLRMVQLYNADGYSECPAGEDGFCPAG